MKANPLTDSVKITVRPPDIAPTMTDLELKLKIAKELPELIDCDLLYVSNNSIFRWLDTGKEVTDREWLYLAQQLENKLTTFDEVNKYFYGELWRLCGNTIKGAATATWQQRAEAYFKVKEGL